MAGAIGSAGAGRSASEGIRSLVLYGYPECPYCRRVLSAISTLGLDVPLRDTMRDDAANEALVEATGRETVPVLRIEGEDGSVRWMPESAEIVAWLGERFAAR